MSGSKKEKEFVSYIVDLMQSMGPVYSKGMFGGHGIFLDGLMFGLVADNVLYLKTDKQINRLNKTLSQKTLHPSLTPKKTKSLR